MLRPFLLAILSCAGAEGVQDGVPEGTPAALHLVSADTGRATDAYAVIDGDEVFVSPAALGDLGLSAFAGDPRSWIRLSSAPGVTAILGARTGVVRISCTSACYAGQAIGAGPRPPPEIARDAGAFFNTDAVLTHVDDRTDAAAAFELGGFGAQGFVEATWTAALGDASRAVRLETRWTSDDPGARVRYRVGDAVGRAGAFADAFRFAGVQIGRDFTLEPGFVTTPTPTLAGAAAMPSVVELYVDDALRLRERVEAGPFTIVDAPVVSGAGAARIVITDVLGRQQVIAQPFYGGRAMLRPGLSDFALSVGALRENFSIKSNDYRGAIAAGVYRRGLTPNLTVDVRADAVEGRSAFAAGASWTPGLLGQFDASLAQGAGQGGGAIARLGWARRDRTFSFSADLEAAGDGVTRIGAARALPRLRSAVTAGATTRRGAIAFSGTHADRPDDADVATAALDFQPRIPGRGALGLGLLYTDDGESALSATISLSAPFGAGRGASGAVTLDDDRLSWQARAQQSPPLEGGLGWRIGVQGGDQQRSDAALALRGRYGEGDLEASRALGSTGLRAQAAFGLVWIDGGVHATAPVRESFALVDAGAPGVHVLHENRRVGLTGPDGLLLLTNIRAYERNRIGLEIDDLPVGAPLARDALEVTPAARSGVVVRFPVDGGAAGEVRLVDDDGAALPAGAILTADARRFPVGSEGRVYLSGVEDVMTLWFAETCAAVVDRAAVTAGAEVVCRRPG